MQCVSSPAANSLILRNRFVAFLAQISGLLQQFIIVQVPLFHLSRAACRLPIVFRWRSRIAPECGWILIRIEMSIAAAEKWWRRKDLNGDALEGEIEDVRY